MEILKPVVQLGKAQSVVTFIDDIVSVVLDGELCQCAYEVYSQDKEVKSDHI